VVIGSKLIQIVESAANADAAQEATAQFLGDVSSALK
jgi:tryptophan synthase alpha subunit